METGDADGLSRAYYPELKKREDRPYYPEPKKRNEDTAVLMADEGLERDDDQAPRLEESPLLGPLPLPLDVAVWVSGRAEGRWEGLNRDEVNRDIARKQRDDPYIHQHTVVFGDK